MFMIFCLQSFFLLKKQEAAEKKGKTGEKKTGRVGVSTCSVRLCNTAGSILSRGSDEGVKAKSSL